jgi:hypothetical protein
MNAKVTGATLQFLNVPGAYDPKNDVIEPDAECAIYFTVGSPAREGTALLTVAYEGPGSGLRARLVADLNFDGENFTFVKERVEVL